MNKEKVWFRINVRLALVLLGALLLTGCNSDLKVGTLQNESQSVELGDAKSVRVNINFGAGDLDVTGGAEKLMEADFTYNVAKLKPEVEYKNDRLVVKQPDVDGLPIFQGITNFRNEWFLRLYDGVPMDLKVEVGAGNNDLKLAGLSLTGLDINLGAGESTVDLSGAWTRNFDIKIETGAANLSVMLPREVGVRIKVDTGLVAVETSGLTKEGGAYVNAAYGVSDVTLQLDLEAGIGRIRLEVEEAAAASE